MCEKLQSYQIEALEMLSAWLEMDIRLWKWSMDEYPCYRTTEFENVMKKYIDAAEDFSSKFIKYVKEKVNE